MLRHQSIATIDNPEFINLQPLDISPLISSCDVKVMYIGENRNRSFISKDIATDMAKTLRGCPIVGYYKEEKEDFSDHGHRVIFDDEGVKFECLTSPFGFIAPDAKVWFQKFKETTPLGEEVEREYLMTTGYLWTGQFEAAKKVFEDNGKGQSMELGDDVKGEWYTKENGIDLFIISDAIFSKLCILGDDVEPCFEGASVTPHEYSLMDKEFTTTLYTMMSELKEVLSKGGQEEMEDVKENVSVQTEEFTEEQAPVVDEGANTVEESTPATEPEFEKNKDEGEEEEKKNDDDNKNSDEDEKEKKYQLLETEYAELKTKYDNLQTEFEALVEYKNKVEDMKKDELIKSFYFLSDEDKKDVIANKSNYTYDEIEAKLSIISVRNKVSFSLDEEKTDVNEKSAPVTFSLNDVEDNSVPAWVKLASSMTAI